MRLARVLPGVAIGFVAVVILGPGNTRPVLGARVYAGAPARPDTTAGERLPLHRSVRVIASWRLGDAEQPAGREPVEVHVRDDVLRVVTRDDGVAEVAFPDAVPDGADLHVDGASGALAHGPLHVEGVLERPARPRWTRVEGPSGSALELRPLRGQIVPPFREVVAVRGICRPPGDPHGGARGESLSPDSKVSIDLIGASPAHVDARVPHARPLVTFEVTPEAMRVDAQVEVEVDGTTCRYEGSFDSVPGGLWLDPSSPPDRIDVVAPGPSKAAYLSFYGPSGRVGGDVVLLAADAEGFQRGSVARPDVAPLTVVAAGDATEQSASTVSWDVRPTPSRDPDAPVGWEIASSDGGRSPLRLVRVLDGVPAALAVEQSRVRRVRGMAIAVALVVGVLEILLLVREGRRAQRDLDAHFAAQADAADGEEAGAAIREVARNAAKSGSVMATILGAMVALAFGIVAAFVVAR